MDVHVHDLPAIRLLGPTTRVPLIYEGVNPHIAEFLQSLPRGTNATLEEYASRLGLAEATDGPRGVLAVSDDLEPDSAEGSLLTYQHGIAVPIDTDPKLVDVPDIEVEAIDVPAGSWAAFASSGPFPETLQSIWARTATEWFPSQPYHQRPGPSLLSVELRGTPEEIAAGTGTADAVLWLPVERA